MSRPIRVFVSSTSEDKSFLNELLQHLQPLASSGQIDIWHRRLVRAGEHRSRKIDHVLGNADIVVALVSPVWLASKEHCDHMKRALEREADGSVDVVPILIRSTPVEMSLLRERQLLPKDGKPVNHARKRDARWVEIAEELMRVIKHARERVAPKGNEEVADALAQAMAAVARLRSERERLQQRIDAMEQQQTIAEVEQRRHSDTIQRLLAELRTKDVEIGHLSGKLDGAVLQIKSLTSRLGEMTHLENSQTDQHATLLQQRQDLLDENKKLRDQLQAQRDALQLSENRRLVQAIILPRPARLEPGKQEVSWPFRVRNTGAGPIRLLRVKINWLLASSIVKSFSDHPGNRPARGADLFLGRPEKRNISEFPVVPVGGTSSEIRIPFDPTSPVAELLVQQHAARFQDRTTAGWSKALRPMVSLIIEGETNRHREQIELVFS